MSAPTDTETIAALADQLDTTPADLLTHAVESVRAPTETPILTTEQAQDFARHWTQVCHMPDEARRLTLTDREREQLFAWVRAYAETWTPSAGPAGQFLAEAIDLTEAAALRLWQSAMAGHWTPPAGWPS